MGDSLSVDVYETTYVGSVRIFHSTSNAALLQAEEIAGSIRKNKFQIPILNEDGTPTESNIEFTKIESSIVADGVATINLEWKINDFY